MDPFDQLELDLLFLKEAHPELPIEVTTSNRRIEFKKPGLKLTFDFSINKISMETLIEGTAFGWVDTVKFKPADLFVSGDWLHFTKTSYNLITQNSI